MGIHDQLEFLLFSKDHWQSSCTALMPKCLPLVLCKETVKQSMPSFCLDLGQHCVYRWQSTHNSQGINNLLDEDIHSFTFNMEVVCMTASSPLSTPDVMAIRCRKAVNMTRFFFSCVNPYSCHQNIWLTHLGRDKIDAILQTTFSNAISWMKMLKFRLKFHWSMFLRVQLTIFQHWFR